RRSRRPPRWRDRPLRACSWPRSSQMPGQRRAATGQTGAVRTIWSIAHTGHRPASELMAGRPQPHVEAPARAEVVLAAVRQWRLGDVVEVSELADPDGSADR